MTDSKCVGEIVTWSGSRWRVDDRDGEFLRLVRADDGRGALAEPGDVVRVAAELIVF